MGGGYSDSDNIGTNKGSNSTSSIGVYWWNWGEYMNGTNIWSESELNTVNLNTNYIDNIGNTWANKIAETTWKVGGNTYTNIATSAMNVAYQNEVVSPAESTTYNAKIGLMYVSDYGYAASPTYWIYPGYDLNGSWVENYTVWTGNDYSAITEENWMHMGLSEWTMTRYSDSSNLVFVVGSRGYINYDSVGYKDNVYTVRPVFYLNSDITYVSGDGTKNSPIRIN